MHRGARLALGLCLLEWGLGLGARAHAQPIPPLQTGTRNYLQSAYTRVRSGSLIRPSAREVPQAEPELRGALGLMLAGEMEKHYARIAELDVLLERAGREKALGLEERMEATTRREMSRHFRRLQALRASASLGERLRL